MLVIKVLEDLNVITYNGMKMPVYCKFVKRRERRRRRRRRRRGGGGERKRRC
jgi:hypothetical protein